MSERKLYVCEHCATENSGHNQWCMECGLWPGVDYSEPMGSRTVHFRDFEDYHKSKLTPNPSEEER